MKVLDLIDSLSMVVSGNYYPNEFPATAPADSAMVRIMPGSQGEAGVSRPSFQVVVRSSDPATAETWAWDLFDKFNGKRGFDVGTAHVVLCLSANSAPLYIGTDENERPMYSLNFQTIVEVL